MLVKAIRCFFYVSTNTSVIGDSILQVFNSNGLSNAYNDDGGPPSASGFSSSVLAGSIVNLDGTLRTKIDGFGSAVLSPYEFWQIVVRPNEFGIEIEPNNSTLQATAFTNVAL